MPKVLLTAWAGMMPCLQLQLPCARRGGKIVPKGVLDWRAVCTLHEAKRCLGQLFVPSMSVNCRVARLPEIALAPPWRLAYGRSAREQRKVSCAHETSCLRRGPFGGELGHDVTPDTCSTQVPLGRRTNASPLFNNENENLAEARFPRPDSTQAKPANRR